MGKKILIVTEAYSRTVNGVWTTLKNTKKELIKLGYSVVFITPAYFAKIDCPTYKSIKLVINPWKFDRIYVKHKPDYIHIATEGPLALYAARYCYKNNIPFTTSFHTKIPEYIHERIPLISTSIGYAYLRYLHKNSKSVLVTTESMKNELQEKGFQNLIVWGRGADTSIFNSTQRIPYVFNNDKFKMEGEEEPLTASQCGFPDKKWYVGSGDPFFWGSYYSTRNVKLLYVGRISPEKNLEAFLDINITADKIVVGDGPLLEYYKNKYPSVEFKGLKRGKALAFEYANADVNVFPSLTDTFGITMIESSACGTPVAAFPVTGPIDFVREGVTGCLDNNLETAVNKCLLLSREACEKEASQYTWKNATEIFEKSLTAI